MVSGPVWLQDEVVWDGRWAVEDDAKVCGMPSWPETMRGLNPQLRHFEDNREP